jgi:hypothetical protein
MTTALMTSALALASQGMPVFFCASDKRPTTPHGFHDATTDPVAVVEMYGLHPGPLVGIPTGETSGIDVLDLDRKHDTAAAWWTTNRKRIPKTQVHRTRSGGLHLLFRHAASLRNSASKIALGVDTRGDGGYVIWWPASGFEVLSTAPVVAWPSWLLAELLPKKTDAVPISREVQDTLSDRRLRGLVRLVAGAPEGRRNQILFWAACRLAGSHAETNITEAFAREVLVDAAQRSGLGVAEAQRTIQSALRRVS